MLNHLHNIRCRRASGIDDDICMVIGDSSAAYLKAPQSE
jgi:hypothetical protein